MLSLKKCRQIIDPKSKKYSDEQVISIRDYLTKIAKLNVQLYLEQKEKKRVKPIVEL